MSEFRSVQILNELLSMEKRMKKREEELDKKIEQLAELLHFMANGTHEK